MKKAMLHTKVSVKLRKSELRNEWYLYLEAYPVFKPGHDKPCREREYLNRIITTPIWDKTRPARLNDYGVQTYKPKRDMNGIIICRSNADRETCIFADNVRILRQREYDNAELILTPNRLWWRRKPEDKPISLNILESKLQNVTRMILSPSA